MVVQIKIFDCVRGAMSPCPPWKQGACVHSASVNNRK
jgi:hypothetical protein